jgi:hypothetical protein
MVTNRTDQKTASRKLRVSVELAMNEGKITVTVMVEGQIL